MKINAVIKPKKIKIPAGDYDKNNIMMFLSLGSGMISGCIIYICAQEYISSGFLKSFLSFSVDFSQKNSIEIFSGILLSHIPFLFFIYIFGTSVYGSTLVTLTGFLKALGLGVISAFLYASYGLKGIEYAVIVFFPGKFILIFALVYIGDVSIKSSEMLKSKVRGESSENFNLTEYSLKMTFSLLLIVLSAFIDFFMIICFSSLFDFS